MGGDASPALLVAFGVDQSSRRRLAALIAALFRQPDGLGPALRIVAKFVRLLFAPDVFLRQFSLAIILHLILLARRGARAPFRALRRLRSGAPADWDKLDRATSYQEYAQAAAAIDASSTVAIAWKSNPRSALYPHEAVRALIDELHRCRRENHVFELMYQLRSRMYRTQFAIGRPELYNGPALCGTKHVLDEYLEATVEAIRHVKDAGLSAQRSNDGVLLTVRDVLAFFNETRHAFGRTALHLSGGAALGVHHLGVLKAMLELRLLPRILSGSSAGSIIAAMAGVRTSAELQELLFDQHALETLVTECVFFEEANSNNRPSSSGGGGEDGGGGGAEQPAGGADSGAGAAERADGPAARDAAAEASRRGPLARLGRLLRTLWSRQPILSVEVLGQTIYDLVGDVTFLEAFNHTGRILNVMVSRSDGREPMLLNYLTAPHVLIWSACRASSAVPGIFAACELWARDHRGQAVPLAELKFTDGCVDSDLPKARLTELFNINFFIVSQVNPAATILSTKAIDESGIANGGITASLLRMLRAEATSYIRTISELTLGRLPFKTNLSRFANLVVQEYDGDVNLFPRYPTADLLHMIDNPTAEYVRKAVLRGQRAVWVRASQLRSLCRIEVEMDAVCHELHSKLLAGGGGAHTVSASRRASSDLVAHANSKGGGGSAGIGQVPSYNTLDSVLRTNGGGAAAQAGTSEPPSPSASHRSLQPSPVGEHAAVLGGGLHVHSSLQRSRYPSAPMHANPNGHAHALPPGLRRRKSKTRSTRRTLSNTSIASTINDEDDDDGAELSSVPPIASRASYLNLAGHDHVDDDDIVTWHMG